MFIRQFFRRLMSGCRGTAEFVVDIAYLLFALCVEIVDRFESRE